MRNTQQFMSREPVRLSATIVVSLVFMCTFAVAGAAESDVTQFLKIDEDTLRVRAKEIVRFKLDVPGIESWATANIGQMQVRTYGKVETIIPASDETSREFSYQFQEPGYAVVILAAGPASAKGRSDSVNRTPYCAKLLVRVDPATSESSNESRLLKSAGLTAKVGMKVEVCPYIDPTHLSPKSAEGGADLPVRVYYEGTAQPNVKVRAIEPNGALQTKTTDAKGITVFKINQAGRWLIRYEHEADGVTSTGDLVFEVESEHQLGER